METIGDAYMVVSGVPEAIDDHAQRVADFALSAIEVCKEVKSPATGQSLQAKRTYTETDHKLMER